MWHHVLLGPASGGQGFVLRRCQSLNLGTLEPPDLGGIDLMKTLRKERPCP